MKIVMPSVVEHSDDAPYMSVGRFETGPDGNPHFHGFSLGVQGPRLQRVRADVVEGEAGSEAPGSEHSDAGGEDNDEEMVAERRYRDVAAHVLTEFCAAEHSEGCTVGELELRVAALCAQCSGVSLGDGYDEEVFLPEAQAVVARL